MMALDPSIKFEGAARAPRQDRPHPPALPQAQPTPVSQSPTITNPSPGSIGAFVASILAGLFKRR